VYGNNIADHTKWYNAKAMTIASIIFYLLLIDAIFAVLISWSGKTGWWYQSFTPLARQFPLVKGWTAAYLGLTLFIGWILHTSGNLVMFW
jgi:hypothetical protein